MIAHDFDLEFATEFTIERLAANIKNCLADSRGYSESDALRVAAMGSPKTMTTAQWVAACALLGINSGTARNRLREGRL